MSARITLRMQDGEAVKVVKLSCCRDIDKAVDLMTGIYRAFGRVVLWHDVELVTE